MMAARPVIKFPISVRNGCRFFPIVLFTGQATKINFVKWEYFRKAKKFMFLLWVLFILKSF